MQRYAQALWRRCICRCYDHYQFPSRGSVCTHQWLNGRSAARSGLQLRRKGICACAAGHQVYVYFMCFVYHLHLAVSFDIPSSFYWNFYQRRYSAYRNGAGHAHLFLWFLYDGIANVRTDCCRWPGALQTSDLFLSAAQGIYCHSFNLDFAETLFFGGQRSPCFVRSGKNWGKKNGNPKPLPLQKKSKRKGP